MLASLVTQKIKPEPINNKILNKTNVIDQNYRYTQFSNITPSRQQNMLRINK